MKRSVDRVSPASQLTESHGRTDGQTEITDPTVMNLEPTLRAGARREISMTDGQAAGSDPVLVLREALDKATEGPWEVNALGGLTSVDRISEDDDDLGDEIGHGYETCDADFIAAARNLLPVLLDEVEALRKVVQDVRALHVPWYEVNGVRYEMRAYSNEAPEGHVCVKPGESPYGDECNAEEEAHYVLACAECRCVVEDGEVAGYWLWPCDTARLLAVLDKEEEK